MAHNPTAWRLAKPPNYIINVNKFYPSSEVPFSKDVLVKIPTVGLVDLVDYWGEGRIITGAGISGFHDCYNVNHQYQLVSNGPDIGRKIPNRIPVISYTNCDTSNYINDNSVKVVTLMAAPINKSCAADIARMINDTEGKVVIYGFDENSMDVKNLESELEGKVIIYCYNYELPKNLKGLTLHDTWRVYLNATELKEELYNCIMNRAFDRAVTISKTIHNTNNGDMIYETVMKLLKAKIKYVMGYAYKLWNGDARDIVTNFFPASFKLILNEDEVKIINKKDMLALKLDVHTDSYDDRLAWGDSKDKSSERVRWKLIPVWKDDMVYFKIKNVDYNMYLKLDVTSDSYNDRQAWGSKNSSEERHEWSVEPLKYDDDILFFIVNRKYLQGLKLDVNTDVYGDRLLWGHHGTVYGNPEYFGWFITSWR